ncbi:GDSL-type esterase/lipase family protein [Leifsonia aquatica]|uniref:GDSL-like protein n=2 Tax=Leifsonia aquatica TaxID=144185 RepID=U2RE39_LEIAQ|nr:GDSL-type esterase/lipase family protein [Leifsonia aquatica]ERK73515.1 GDSL-like protein [Leifsonia aquatica ATCC 14665]MBB2967963.1 lysophospholipase L1-like esterase [Leifsonia aquatica]
MREHTAEAATQWRPTWGQAVSDFRGEDDEPGFADVTVRMVVPASLGGSLVRVELSNRFGVCPVRIGRAAIGVGGRFVELAFDGQRSLEIPVGESRWCDPAELAVQHGDEISIDVYLPESTPYATAGGFHFARSRAGDFVGVQPFPLEGTAVTPIDEAREFPAPNTGTSAQPDGSGWSLPAGGPFLRTIEVAGTARAVVVALGGSSTAMGWPQYAAAVLPADARIAVVNRGISGNRIRLNAPQQSPSWGLSGLARFDDDVLDTSGVTHVVIAYNSNDWGLPGRVTPWDEMPTIEELIDGYERLVERAKEAGLSVILATVTPLASELFADPDRERMRSALNNWIRGSRLDYVDFDAAIRSRTDPSRLDGDYAAPDDTHPNINGEKRLAKLVADSVASLWSEQ